MQTNSRIKSLPLPEDKKEAVNAVKAFLFGPVKKFTADDLENIDLRQGGECHTYAVIDAIHTYDAIILAHGWEAGHECLWKGESEEQFSLYAPYVVRLDDENPFTDWLLNNGWGKGWGIYLRSYLPLNKLAHELRKINMVYDEVERKWSFFRFYSPRTVKEFIPFLPAKEFIAVTNGIKQIISEDIDANNILFM